MARLRHIGIACRDPWATADFYIKVFGMTKIGEIPPEHKHAAGVYLTDGTMTITMIRFKTVEYAGEDHGVDFVGLHHIGFEVDNHDETRAAVEASGGKYMWDGGRDHKKYRDPDQLILEVTAEGFPTTEGAVVVGATLPGEIPLR